MKTEAEGIEKMIDRMFTEKGNALSIKNKRRTLPKGTSPRLNLQIFADSGDKTEKATPRKRTKAREEGQVLQSKEMTSAIILLSMFMTMKIFGRFMYEEILGCFNRVFTIYLEVDDLFDINGILKIFNKSLITLLKTTAPLFMTALLVSLVSGYAQVGFLFTTKTLNFKPSKLNPINGLKRIFSFRSLMESIKSILKIIVIGWVGYSYIKGQAGKILTTMDMDVIAIASYIGVTAINVGIRMCIVLLAIGVADYGYQWWEYEKNLKMSKQEIKEEHKEMEGNPEIRSKIRQKQRQISMRRMLQDVPKADVIITNPTHFAVAVRYDQESSNAPTVIAKGQDYMAMRIKEIARENQVEVVENKSLARTLYQATEIGDEIPQELYQAVAEVLAYVYSLKQRDGSQAHSNK